MDYPETPLEPTATEPEPTEDPAHAFHVSQFNVLYVTCQKVRRETQRDPTLVKVYESTMKGWKNEQAPSMPPFYSRKDELTVHQGCIMWGSRVVVPTKLRRQILEVLHESHIGVVKMKALPRSYIWWPGIDREIEELARGCSGCQRVQHAPKSSPLHLWEWPSSPWQIFSCYYDFSVWCTSLWGCRASIRSVVVSLQLSSTLYEYKG